MFSIHCPTCTARSLVGTDAIVSLHDTDHGPVAVVRCPRGHLVAHSFRRGTTHAVTGAGERAA